MRASPSARFADKAFNPNQPRDKDGKWTSTGAGGEEWTDEKIRQEIKQGREAMRRVIDDKTDILSAMRSPQIDGAVSFYWGTPAGGVRHIVEGRGAGLAMRLPTVVGRGSLKVYSTGKGRARFDLTYRGYTATIARDRFGVPDNWLVTGFKRNR